MIVLPTETTSLTHTPSRIVQQALINAGLADDPTTLPLGSWPVSSAAEADTPDNFITVTFGAGDDFGRLEDGVAACSFGIQVRVRAKDEQTGWAKANAIRTWMAETLYDMLITVTSPTPSANYSLLCFVGVGQVLSLGYESPTSRRRLFTLNAKAVITPQE